MAASSVITSERVEQRGTVREGDTREAEVRVLQHKKRFDPSLQAL